MTVQHYELGPDAAFIDRVTLRVFNWWRGTGRDFVTAYFLTQLALAAILAIPLTATPNQGLWPLVGAIAAALAPVAAWMAHRRRHGWSRPAQNHRAQRWGIALGVLLMLGTGVFLMLPIGYIGIGIAMLAPQGPLVLLPAVGTGLVGWAAATVRKRQLDNPIYP